MAARFVQGVQQWGASVQAALSARGFDMAQAHQGALAQLAAMVEQQARLIACEDIYRLIAVLALGAAAFHAGAAASGLKRAHFPAVSGGTLD